MFNWKEFLISVLIIIVLIFAFQENTSTEKLNIPTYNSQLKYLPYSFDNGVKVFHLTASHFYWKILENTSIEVYGFNNQIPGPIIRAKKGETVRIFVKNNLTESLEQLTVHWHGLDIPNEMDGVPFLTQDPIKPGEEFIYEFTLNQTGTYMYHTHFNVPVQVDMGLSGPFIITDDDGVLEYDDEYIFMLDDWSIDENGNNLAKTVLPHNRVYNYYTINGKSFPETEKINIFNGDKMLIRLINIGNNNVPLHLHGPHFKIVSQDGNDVSLLNFWRDTIDIAPGQRVDIEINASNPGNWLFHSHNTRQIVNNGKYPGGLISVLIHWDGPRPSANYGQ